MAKPTVAVRFKGEGKEEIVKYFRSAISDIRKEADKIFSGSKSNLFSGVAQPTTSRSRTTTTTTRGNDLDMAKALAEIRKYQNEQKKAEEEITRHIRKQAEEQYQARVKQWVRGAQEFQKISKGINRAGGSGDSDFISTLFGGSRLGSIAGAGSIAGGVASGVLLVADSIKAVASATTEVGRQSLIAGANFEQTFNAMKAVTGSSRLAREELNAIAETAKNTTGLRLETAEQGYQRLRALSFESTRARKLIKELAEEKVLSGASNEALERVIFNFTQIASGGQKVGQEIRELLTAMPTLKRALFDAFGTLDPNKIQAVVDTDIDSFFDRLTASMEKNKASSGGLNNAYGKFTDELLKAGRALSLPVIPELTNDLNSMTNSLANNKSAWAEWGENIKIIYTEVRDFVKLSNSFYENQKETENYGEWEISRLARLGPNASKYDGYGPNPISDYLKHRREQTLSGGMDAGERFFEEEVERINKEEKALMLAEKLRQKELASIESHQKLRSSITENGYQIAQAQLDSHLRLTAADELAYIRQTSQLKTNNIRQQMSEQTRFFDRQIILNKGNAEEIGNLTREKNSVLGKLNADLIANEYATAHQIAENERRVLLERRQANIEFSQIQLQLTADYFERQTFDIERQIRLSSGFQAENYTELIRLANDFYAEQIRLNTEALNLKLQDERLTEEQIRNITAQGFAEEQRLAEENRRKLADIQDRQTADRIEKLKVNNERYLTQINSFFDAISQMRGFVDGYAVPDDLLGTINLFRTENLKKKQDAENYKLQSENKARVSGWTLNSFADTHNAETLLQAAKQQEILIAQLDNLRSSRNKGVAEFGMDAMADRHAQEILDVTALIDLNAKLLALTPDSDKKNLEALKFEQSQLASRKALLGITQDLEAAEYKRNNTVEGLTETYNKIISGKTRKDIVEAAEINLLRERNKVTTELIETEEILGNQTLLNLTREIEYRKNIQELYQQEIDAILRIDRANLELANSSKISFNQIRANVLEHLASQKTINDALSDGIISAYDKTFDFLSEKLGKFGDIPILGDIAKFTSGQFLTKLTTGLMDLFPRLKDFTQQNQTNNPIAKPIVTEQQKTNQILGEIKSALTKPIISGGGVQTNGKPNSLGGIINAVFGGGLGNRNGINSSLIFNHEGFHSQSASLHELGHSGGGSGILGNIKGLFGKNGSIWGEQGFGNNAGTYGAIGGFASLAGGLIGGKWGGILSGAGSGLATGAKIGSMIMPGIGTAVGAAIGAIAGGLFGWFKNRKLEKQDRNENIPALNKGFTDALAKFRELIAKPPDNALEIANDLRNQVAAGFGIQFASKKYTKEAQKLIQSQLLEIDRVPDGLMEQLKASLARAREAKEFSNRFVATFASGTYMDAGFAKQFGDFKRRNGMMPGNWNGVDHIPALIANQEMVLNPAQQRRVIQNAGFDAFAGAGIPNYKSNLPRPRLMAEGAFVGNSPNVSANQSSAVVNNFKIILENVVPLPDAKAYLEGPDGKRQIIEIVGDDIDKSTGQTGIPRKLKQAETR